VKKIKCPYCGKKSKKHTVGGFIYDVLVCKKCGRTIKYLE
jgi:DNA-directed RNA polymerase subunit RPC12/RpoP